MLGVRKVDVAWAGDSWQETIPQKDKVPMQAVRGIGMLTNPSVLQRRMEVFASTRDEA